MPLVDIHEHIAEDLRKRVGDGPVTPAIIKAALVAMVEEANALPVYEPIVRVERDPADHNRINVFVGPCTAIKIHAVLEKEKP